MGKQANIWLIAATVLILVGCILLGGMMVALNFDFTKLSTVKYETNEYTFAETFSSISIKTDDANIVFVPANNGECSVTCFEMSKNRHSVSVKGGSLIIENQDTRKWYDYINIMAISSTKITISLPAAQYAQLSIQEDTGDIELPKDFSFESMDISTHTGDITNYASASSIKIAATTGDIYTQNISADTMELSVSTGKVTARSVACQGNLQIHVSTGDAKLTDVVCNGFVSTGNTGDIKLENVTAAQLLSIARTTGDIDFKSCDAGEIYVITDTGDITGSVLSEKIFIAQTDTGKVDIPNTTTGGKCELTTDTGDIQITIA